MGLGVAKAGACLIVPGLEVRLALAAHGRHPRRERGHERTAAEHLGEEPRDVGEI